jgi:outer membrane immunogenic protein
MLISSVAVIGLTGLAGAADMPIKAPPPVYFPTWTGCYIGGHAGYGVGTSSSQYDPGIDALLQIGAPPVDPNFDNKGFVGGGQTGCQLQTGTFLWGLEGDLSSFSNSFSRNFFNSVSGFLSPSASETLNQTVSYSSLWSVRGRFGGIFSDVYHLYVTAGIAGATANYTSSASFKDRCPFCASTATNVSLNPTGIVLGAGAEWKVWPSVVVGAEYLHYALLSDTALPITPGLLFGIPVSALVGPGPGDHVHTGGVDVIRIRASYLFNWGRLSLADSSPKCNSAA